MSNSWTGVFYLSMPPPSSTTTTRKITSSRCHQQRSTAQPAAVRCACPVWSYKVRRSFHSNQVFFPPAQLCAFVDAQQLLNSTWLVCIGDSAVSLALLSVGNKQSSIRTWKECVRMLLLRWLPKKKQVWHPPEIQVDINEISSLSRKQYIQNIIINEPISLL